MTAVSGQPHRDHVIRTPRRPTDVAGRAHLACVLEAGAPKPGNVSPGRPFADMRYEDFLASAEVLARPLSGAGVRTLGDTILQSVEQTVLRTGVNTNLGIVLLVVPLARAAIRLLDVPAPDDRDARLRALREEVRRVLAESTVEDARKTYAAIRVAHPGGLGAADEQDVAGEPTVTLLEAMRLAADRDGIAREYATAFEVTFERGVPALLAARADGLSLNDAIVETFLTLLAAAPDTHIARRGGDALARRASHLAAEALAAGGVRTEAGRLSIGAMDASLRDARNLGNPGTTADLTAAALCAALLVGGWSLGAIDGADIAAGGAAPDIGEES